MVDWTAIEVSRTVDGLLLRWVATLREDMSRPFSPTSRPFLSCTKAGAIRKARRYARRSEVRADQRVVVSVRRGQYAGPGWVRETAPPEPGSRPSGPPLREYPTPGLDRIVMEGRTVGFTVPGCSVGPKELAVLKGVQKTGRYSPEVRIGVKLRDAGLITGNPACAVVTELGQLLVTQAGNSDLRPDPQIALSWADD